VVDRFRGDPRRLQQDCGAGVVRNRRLLGGIGVGFLTALGVGVWFFCPTPTPDVQLDHFLHHTPKLGIPVEMVQFLLKLLLKQISFCVPRFPLILTAKYHSLYAKESGVGVRNFGKVRVRIWELGVGSRSRIFYLRLRNPGLQPLFVNDADKSY